MGNLNQVRTARTSPGQFGVFNLKPGGSVPINFLVTPEGRPGPIEVRIEGLPEGVTAEPVDVRLGGPPAARGDDGDARRRGDRLDLPAPEGRTLRPARPFRIPGRRDHQGARPVDRPRGVGDDRGRRGGGLEPADHPRPDPVPAEGPGRVAAPVRRPALAADPPEGQRPRPLAPGGPDRPGAGLLHRRSPPTTARPSRPGPRGSACRPARSSRRGPRYTDEESTIRRGRPRPGLDQGPARAPTSSRSPTPRRAGTTVRPRGDGRGQGADRGPPGRRGSIFLKPGDAPPSPSRSSARRGSRGKSR